MVNLVQWMLQQIGNIRQTQRTLRVLIGSNAPGFTKTFFVYRRVPLTGPDLDPLVHGQGYDYAAEPAAEIVADYEAHLVFS
jgi:hypothetical protein